MKGLAEGANVLYMAWCCRSLDGVGSGAWEAREVVFEGVFLIAEGVDDKGWKTLERLPCRRVTMSKPVRVGVAWKKIGMVCGSDDGKGCGLEDAMVAVDFSVL